MNKQLFRLNSFQSLKKRERNIGSQKNPTTTKSSQTCRELNQLQSKMLNFSLKSQTYERNHKKIHSPPNVFFVIYSRLANL